MRGSQTWTLKIESEALESNIDGLNTLFSNVSNEVSALDSNVTSLSNSVESVSNAFFTDLSSLSNSVMSNASKISSLQEANRALTENDVQFDSNLTVKGSLVTSGIASFESTVDVSSTLNVGDDAILDSNLTVKGVASFQSNVNTEGLLTVGNDARVSSNLEVLGSAVVTGSFTTSNIVNATGGINAGTILPLSNEVFDLGSTLLRWRDLFLSGNTIDLGGTRLQSDSGTGNLRVSDNANQLKSLVASEVQIGDVIIDPETGRNIKSVIRGDGKGRAQIQTLAESEDSSFVVASNVSTDFDVKGSVIVQNLLTVGGQASFASNIEVVGGMDVTGDAFLRGVSMFEGVCSFSSNVGFNGPLAVGDKVVFNSNLEVVGGALFSSNLTVDGELIVRGGITIKNGTSSNDLDDDTFSNENLVEVKGGLAVDGDLTTSCNVFFNGPLATLNTKVDIFGPLSVTGHVNMSNNLGVKGNLIAEGDVTAGDSVSLITLKNDVVSNTNEILNLSSNIDALQSDFLGFSNVVLANSNEISNLSSNIDALQSDFLGLSNVVLANSNDISTIDTTLTSLSNYVYLESNVTIEPSLTYSHLSDASNVNVGIGLSNALDRLHVSGNVRASGDVIAEGSVASESDKRLKADVTAIEDSLEIIKGMKGVKYSLISDEKVPPKQYCGLIAQNVMEVLPEVVDIQSNGMYTVAYGNIVSVLIEAVKELETKLYSVQAEVDTLKSYHP